MSAAPRLWGLWFSFAAAAIAGLFFLAAPSRIPAAAPRSVHVQLSAARAGNAVLVGPTPARSPSPAPLHARRSSGAVIVYVLVLLVFVGLYIFMRDRLRRT